MVYSYSLVPFKISLRFTKVRFFATKTGSDTCDQGRKNWKNNLKDCNSEKCIVVIISFEINSKETRKYLKSDLNGLFRKRSFCLRKILWTPYPFFTKMHSINGIPPFWFSSQSILNIYNNFIRHPIMIKSICSYLECPMK